MTTGKLDGRVAIITGSGGGLGAECARVLASHGAHIAVVDINGEAAQQVAESIVAQGGQAIGLCTDVSSEESVEAMVAAVVERFGRIDILHNNAAVLDVGQRQRDRDICNLDMAAWDRAIAVNLRGAVLCSKYSIPVMLKQGKGSVIFATSGLGVQGDLSLTGYATSKAALIMLPRLIAAHMTPELGTPRDIANVVAFLACDESSFVTGTTLVADGGFSSHTPSLVAMREFFQKSGKEGM